MARATAWEVHPITQFEVCTGTKASCDGGSDWRTLAAEENMRRPAAVVIAQILIAIEFLLVALGGLLAGLRLASALGPRSLITPGLLLLVAIPGSSPSPLSRCGGGSRTLSTSGRSCLLFLSCSQPSQSLTVRFGPLSFEVRLPRAFRHLPRAFHTSTTTTATK